MVDLVKQLRDGVEKKYSRESLEIMLTWAADEIDRLRDRIANRENLCVELIEKLHAIGDTPPVSNGVRE